MKKWMVAAKKADFNAIGQKFGISPMLARIIRNRDVTGDKAIDMFLSGDLNDLYDPMLLKDMDRALEIIEEGVMRKEHIRVVGDYDIDGVCSTYILIRGLSLFGANVDHRLPDRIKDGYGINESMVDEAKEDLVDIILTCDNGIAAAKELEHARSLGMRVIVTDHHEVPFEEEDGVRKYILPKADAVIDPKRVDCSYPYREICGAVVALKLIFALHNKAPFLTERDRRELISFAAFATVGDIMPLLDENRILVRYGLEFMKNTDNPGLDALLDTTKVDRRSLSPYIIGFVLGPCINATGRLDSAERALDLFMAGNAADASRLANELRELNESRKEMTEYYTEYARNLVLSGEETGDGLHNFSEDKVLVIYLPDCHESLAGIVAGRIKEYFYKPTFVITRTSEGCKGSGRSIEAYDMHEEMTRCADLFDKFGGHKMAAGFSLPEENISGLRERLNAASRLSEDDLTEKIVMDIAMPINYATLEFAKELETLSPFGTGNPKPLFGQSHLEILSVNVFGKNRNVVKLKLRSNEDGAALKAERDAVWFGDGDEFLAGLNGSKMISIIYTPQVNSYMGRETLQLNIRDYKAG